MFEVGVCIDYFTCLILLVVGVVPHNLHNLINNHHHHLSNRNHRLLGLICDQSMHWGMIKDVYFSLLFWREMGLPFPIFVEFDQ